MMQNISNYIEEKYGKQIEDVLSRILSPFFNLFDNYIEPYLDRVIDDLHTHIDNTSRAIDLRLDKLEENLEKYLTGPIASKILHAHSFDNSETKDLISDLVSGKQPTSLELLLRNIQYTIKTFIYIFNIA